MEEPPPNVFLLDFAPETWSSLHKLSRLTGPPLPDDGNVRIGLRDCDRHLDKVTVLWRVASRLRGNLLIDREELDRIGGTANVHSKEFAAVCEALVCSLYSALDGLRTFIFGAYRRVQGVQNGSNGKLFERAAESKYGSDFPEGVRVLLAEANAAWFPRLRRFRTELTHGSTGSCHLDVSTDKVRYMNDGIIENGRAYFEDDIEGVLREFETETRRLIEGISKCHLSLLEPVFKFHVCGVFRGRLYTRMVASRDEITWQDGHCASFDWFEHEEGFQCPLAKRCAAYQRKWPGGSAAVLGRE